MNIKHDAFGQAIWAYFKGNDSYEIIERDDGYFDATLGPNVYFSYYKDWPRHEKEAMKFVKGRVLDVGCGAGRHSLYLQKKGFDVVGIDNSPLAIKVCKLRGLRKAKLMSVTQVNFRPNSFDTIIMLGNNFGLLGNLKRAKWLLKRFHKMTSNKALIVAESNDPYETKNQDHLWYHKFNRRRGRMPGQLRIRVRFGKSVGKWFDYLMVSRDEMAEILDGTGWKIRRIIGSKGSQYVAIIAKVQN
jgi:SAM-dependent methyltransferase